MIQCQRQHSIILVGDWIARHFLQLIKPHGVLIAFLPGLALAVFEIRSVLKRMTTSRIYFSFGRRRWGSGSFSASPGKRMPGECNRALAMTLQPVINAESNYASFPQRSIEQLRALSGCAAHGLFLPGVPMFGDENANLHQDCTGITMKKVLRNRE